MISYRKRCLCANWVRVTTSSPSGCIEPNPNAVEGEVDGVERKVMAKLIMQRKVSMETLRSSVVRVVRAWATKGGIA
ncbi:hypothetical protein AKJ16_DCAP21901 [Drosera capensis]